VTEFKVASDLKAAIRACRAHFAAALVFQGIVSILALAYPLFMLQAYERVIPSRNLATLAALLGGVIVLISFLACSTICCRP